MKESAISVRIDAETKKKVEEVFKKLGLSHSSAISLFYSQVLLHKGLPFDVKSSKGIDCVADKFVEYGKDEKFKNAIVELAQKYIKEKAHQNNVESTKELLKMVKKAKKMFQGTGFIILGVFGSFARDEADDKSDIDILYELSSEFREKHKGFKAIAEIDRIKDKLGNLFNRKVDLVNKSTQKEGKSRILDEVVYV